MLACTSLHGVFRFPNSEIFGRDDRMKFMLPGVHAHAYKCTRARARTLTHTCMHEHVHTRTRTCMNAAHALEHVCGHLPRKRGLTTVHTAAEAASFIDGSTATAALYTVTVNANTNSFILTACTRTHSHLHTQIHVRAQTQRQTSVHTRKESIAQKPMHKCACKHMGIHRRPKFSHIIVLLHACLPGRPAARPPARLPV